MNINDRIRAIRKTLKLNQADFGKRIGMKQTSVSFMESAGSTITEQNIRIICATFGVNETWLRTGAGEMFNTSETDDLFAQLAERYQLDYVGQEIIRTYLQMDNAGRAAITRFAMMLTANVQRREDELSKTDASSPAPNRTAAG